MSTDAEQPFKAPLPYQDVSVSALSVYCSDGRFVQQTEAFLKNQLNLPAHDSIVFPGGAGVLAGRPAEFRDAEVIGENLSFLQRAHELKTVVLIAHEDCGYYRGRVGVDSSEMECLQLQDLRKAAGRVRASAPAIELLAFYARGSESGVVFEPVQL